MEQEFNSPFDFFQAFGDYWEGQGWQKIGHQLEDLFTRLHSFLELTEHAAYGYRARLDEAGLFPRPQIQTTQNLVGRSASERPVGGLYENVG